MTEYENAQEVRSCTMPQPDGGEVQLRQLEGEGPAEGHRCIHRLLLDAAGKLRSDIVYFYDANVPDSAVESDFRLLCSPGLMSVSQLHHTESMLNRRHRALRN